MTISMLKKEITTTDNLYALVQSEGDRITIELTNDVTSLYITQIKKEDVLTALLADDEGCDTLQSMVTEVFARSMSAVVANAVGVTVAQVVMENCYVSDNERDTDGYNYTYDDNEQAWWCAQHGIDHIHTQIAVHDVQ